MNISRRLANSIRFVLDELVPPVIRDSRWFMWLPFKMMFGKKSHYFLNFKRDFPTMSDADLVRVYQETEDVHISRPTDLNDKCIQAILEETTGVTVLDAGCGRGFLAGKLEKNHTVTGVDFIESPAFKEAAPSSEFVQADLSSLPFADDSFDTVICTHTLEHVKDIGAVIAELKRVCRQQMILVVPRQRSYQYTFDLHIHFFAHQHEFLGLMSSTGLFEQWRIDTLDGDIFFQQSGKQ